jgi:hypothetical protein
MTLGRPYNHENIMKEADIACVYTKQVTTALASILSRSCQLLTVKRLIDHYVAMVKGLFSDLERIFEE